MVKIKMLQTRRGTEDGFNVKQYQKDEIYSVTDKLGYMFISQGYAELTQETRCSQGKHYNAEGWVLCCINEHNEPVCKHCGSVLWERSR